MSVWYKLVDKKPVAIEIEQLTDADYQKIITNKRIGNTHLSNGIRVSTVFLCINHNFSGTGDPVLFETMAFPEDSYEEIDMDRYTTYEDALQGHWNMVKKHGGQKPLKLSFDNDLFEI